MSSRITSRNVFRNSASEINKYLGSEIVDIESLSNVYGSSSNNFIINTRDASDKLKKYILKFSLPEHVENEIKGDRLIRNYLPTPALVLSSKKKVSNFGWTLYDYLDGKLMIEKFIDAESQSKHEEMLELEQNKEELLKNLHKFHKNDFDFSNYFQCRANLLFYDRLMGKRFKNFYQATPDNLSSCFSKKIYLNGKPFPLTVKEVFDQILNKYIVGKERNKNLLAILGHGDAHYGNIIVNKKIWFIDNEYAGYMTPFMELAKPYYNDFIGNLFFHYNSLLNEYFQVKSFDDKKDSIQIKINTGKEMKLRSLITEIKISSRRLTVNKKTRDYLSLNDYLILCHTLTKNPNKYERKAQIMFLVFILILANFDPFDPNSIYKFF